MRKVAGNGLGSTVGPLTGHGESPCDPRGDPKDDPGRDLIFWKCLPL